MKTPSWAALGLSRARMAVVVVVWRGWLAAGLRARGDASRSSGRSRPSRAVGRGRRVLRRGGIPEAVAGEVGAAPGEGGPALAASAAVYLQSTGSRAKTVMMLHSDEPRLAALFERAKRATLLGMDASAAFWAGRGDAGRFCLWDTRARWYGPRGSKLHGRRRGARGDGPRFASRRRRPSFPVFLTISFFLPIMLMLLAAVGHHDDPSRS